MLATTKTENDFDLEGALAGDIGDVVVALSARPRHSEYEYEAVALAYTEAHEGRLCAAWSHMSDAVAHYHNSGLYDLRASFPA